MAKGPPLPGVLLHSAAAAAAAAAAFSSLKPLKVNVLPEITPLWPGNFIAQIHRTRSQGGIGGH